MTNKKRHSKAYISWSMGPKTSGIHSVRFYHLLHYYCIQYAQVCFNLSTICIRNIDEQQFFPRDYLIRFICKILKACFQWFLLYLFCTIFCLILSFFLVGCFIFILRLSRSFYFAIRLGFFSFCCFCCFFSVFPPLAECLFGIKSAKMFCTTFIHYAL